MRVIIKAIKKDELILELEPATTVKEVKSKVEAKFGIPCKQQKLLLLGRNLKDEAQMREYPNIRDGTKLTLIEMRVQRPNLQDLVERHFRKFYNEYQSKQLARRFMVELNTNIKNMSLDDIEKLVTSFKRRSYRQN